MSILLVSVISMSVIGALLALVLYVTSRKFYFQTDPKIIEVESMLPQANCGGCGHASCHGFAVACVKADSLHHLICTVGGKSVMENVANALGKTASPIKPTVATVRCGGSCELRARVNQYDGATTCSIVHNLYGGETACSWGCIGLGDCVDVCRFNAIKLNTKTLLPEINADKCTSCNACILACPKGIIELRNMNENKHRIYVNCVTKDVSVIDSCSVACNGCTDCINVCADNAIQLINKTAYIDSSVCTLCGKCVAVCPTHAIVELN